MGESGDIIEFPTVLLERASTGDEKAFREIYDKISGKMYNLCLRYAGRTNDANDLFQEGFVRLYKYLGTFRNEGSFEGWARRIFVSTCLDAIKKRSLVFSEVNGDMDVVAYDSTGYDMLSLQDMMKVVRQLPDGYRTVINLAAIEGYSHKEIGTMLGISESASKSQLHKARTYLRKLLSNRIG